MCGMLADGHRGMSRGRELERDVGVTLSSPSSWQDRMEGFPGVRCTLRKGSGHGPSCWYPSPESLPRGGFQVHVTVGCMRGREADLEEVQVSMDLPSQ